jgi:dTDP-4-dehydrorhamnose 3,5-epimerase
VKFQPTEIDDVVIIDIQAISDNRGFFARGWCTDEFAEHGLNVTWVQSNIGYSKCAGTLRGMHYQRAPYGEAKLVRCTNGAVFDVAIDLRTASPTYRSWVGVILRAEEHRMIFLPEGFAHGYQTLRDDSEIEYFTSHRYAAAAATGVRYDDPVFGIEWPAEVSLISQQDSCWPLQEMR